MNSEMNFASAATNEPNLEDVLGELKGQLTAELNGNAVDLMIVFMARHFVRSAQTLVARLRDEFQPRVLLACTTEGVIGRQEEIEGENGVAVVAAHLPNVTLSPFTLSAGLDELVGNETVFRRAVGAPDDTKVMLLLADPFTTPMDDVLTAFNTFYPNLPIIGGMASAAHAPGGNVLMLNGNIVQRGAVGVALAGEFEADILVSQGCRPIGEPLKVTKAERNVMLELDDENALNQLRDTVDTLSDEDRELLQHGLMVGRAVHSGAEQYGRGDFLVRGVMGIDPQTGAVAIGDYVEKGETVQFHVRDQNTATEDLELLLMSQMFAEPAKGALLFSCNGRGTRLYDHPNGDIETIQKALGEVALAGFFCAGEIGPIGGKNYLHGQTASMVIFR